MKKEILKAFITCTILCAVAACNPANRLTNNRAKMFTEEQIKETLGHVKSGADFPAYIQEMKSLGVLHYETFLTDGHSVYRGEDNYEVKTGAKFENIQISGFVDKDQLKADISSHQKGESDYLEIIKQCAANGVEKWAVSIKEMTCTYYDKTGNIILTEQIPVFKKAFTLDQIKEAHSKVKSGADFPAYIHEIKKIGVIHYETYVSDGHTDYFGADAYKITGPVKYGALPINESLDKALFKKYLLAHQEGKSDYPTFCRQAADCGVEKWAVSLEKMTCTYYDRLGNKVLVEIIPV